MVSSGVEQPPDWSHPRWSRTSFDLPESLTTEKEELGRTTDGIPPLLGDRPSDLLLAPPLVVVRATHAVHPAVRECEGRIPEGVRPGLRQAHPTVEPAGLQIYADQHVHPHHHTRPRPVTVIHGCELGVAPRRWGEDSVPDAEVLFPMLGLVFDPTGHVCAPSCASLP